MEGRTTRSGYLSSTIEGSHLSQGEPGQWAGQTHLNPDAKIADEGRPQGGGHPQGVPLPSLAGQETGLQSPKT